MEEDTYNPTESPQTDMSDNAQTQTAPLAALSVPELYAIVARGSPPPSKSTVNQHKNTIKNLDRLGRLPYLCESDHVFAEYRKAYPKPGSYASCVKTMKKICGCATDAERARLLQFHSEANGKTRDGIQLYLEANPSTESKSRYFGIHVQSAWEKLSTFKEEIQKSKESEYAPAFTDWHRENYRDWKQFVDKWESVKQEVKDNLLLTHTKHSSPKLWFSSVWIMFGIVAFGDKVFRLEYLRARYRNITRADEVILNLHNRTITIRETNKKNVKGEVIGFPDWFWNDYILPLVRCRQALDQDFLFHTTKHFPKTVKKKGQAVSDSEDDSESGEVEYNDGRFLTCSTAGNTFSGAFGRFFYKDEDIDVVRTRISNRLLRLSYGTHLAKEYELPTLAELMAMPINRLPSRLDHTGFTHGRSYDGRTLESEEAVAGPSNAPAATASATKRPSPTRDASAKAKRAKTAPPSRTDGRPSRNAKKEALVAYCEQQGLDSSGTLAEIRKRLYGKGKQPVA